jgi:hypothetical protein
MRALTLGLACAATLTTLAAAPTTTPTFYKDVLPVLQKNCQNCHRPGEAGPMSFMSYESTRPAAKAIKAAVLTKKMPPWFADPKYGHFENDRTLSQTEVTTLVSWVDAGAPAGNAKDAPKAVNFVEGWNIGKPDVVFEMPTAFKIPAKGTIDYHYVIIPTNFKEDKYVQFAESRPSDRVHTHHILSFLREPGSSWLKGEPVGVAFVPGRNGNGGGEGGGGNNIGDSLGGYAPGTVPNVLRPGQAILIKAGSDLVLQLHYTADGKEGEDRSKVGLIFAKEKPTERLVMLSAQNNRFAIPPGDPNYEVTQKVTLQAESKLMSFLPHMHLRGKAMDFVITYPDGKKETMLSVPHYSFEWQLSYYLANPVILPKGTTVEAIAHFDNSANNPANPDPTKEVHFGEQSWDEMMFGFFTVAVAPDVTVMDLMRPPKPAQKATGAGAAIE